MTVADLRPAAKPTGGDDYDVLHIVGDIQYWLDRMGLKIPRSLCGVLLLGDPDRPDPGPNAPTCPDCQRRNKS